MAKMRAKLSTRVPAFQRSPFPFASGDLALHGVPALWAREVGGFARRTVGRHFARDARLWAKEKR